jgi:hypothetical protein
VLQSAAKATTSKPKQKRKPKPKRKQITLQSKQKGRPKKRKYSNDTEDEDDSDKENGNEAPTTTVSKVNTYIVYNSTSTRILPQLDFSFCFSRTRANRKGEQRKGITPMTLKTRTTVTKRAEMKHQRQL